MDPFLFMSNMSKKKRNKIIKQIAKETKAQLLKQQTQCKMEQEQVKKEFKPNLNVSSRVFVPPSVNHSKRADNTELQKNAKDRKELKTDEDNSKELREPTFLKSQNINDPNEELKEGRKGNPVRLSLQQRSSNEKDIFSSLQGQKEFSSINLKKLMLELE
jgi:hypothetical protein